MKGITEYGGMKWSNKKCNKDNEDSMPTAFSIYSLYLINNSVLRQEWEKMGTVMVWGEESFISAEGLV